MDTIIKQCAMSAAETARLYIRSLEYTDAQDMFAYTSDASTCKFLKWEPHIEVSQAEEFISNALDICKREFDFYWGIVLKTNQQLIGAIHVYSIDLIAKSAYLSYVLGPHHTGKGYMTECLQAVMEKCTQKMNIQVFYADVLQENVASISVLQRIGMKVDDSVAPWNSTVKGMEMVTFRFRKKG